MSSSVTNSPPRAPPIKYTAPLGTRWDKEKAAAGQGAFDLPDDPKRIGPWIIGECVGKGASGRVKIAKHRVTGQLAAVKILPLQPLVNSRASLTTQRDKADKQRLGIDREITMMKLMNHPNIMRIYDVYEGDKDLFLVLEYVEGGELFDFLVNKGRLPPLEALAYFKQIVYGLNYAHTFSIIHRDLKPENILIHSLNPPLIKIADWGMAAFAPPSLQLETSCGSPHYASPEIVNGEKYEGNATDIWSCGVILFALLTGRLPFDDKNVRHLLAKVKIGKFEMPQWIDPLAKDLLSRMLVVDVTKRITIPEILAHPWMCINTPGIIYAPAPPPMELARPISAAHIDAELFESLRVIWGRHADPKGDSIRWELLSPVGHGILAKAFYFLLQRYREGVRTDLRSPEGNDDDTKLSRQYVAPPARISLHPHNHSRRREIRSSRAAPAPPTIQHSSLHTRADTSNVESPGPPIVTILPLVTPEMSRASTTSHSRPSTPAGPRAISTQSPAPTSRHARNTTNMPPPPLFVQRGKSQVTSHCVSIARPAMPTRAHTYTANVPISDVQFPERSQASRERSSSSRGTTTPLPQPPSLQRRETIHTHVIQPQMTRVEPSPPVITQPRFSAVPLDVSMWAPASPDPSLMSPPISHAPIIHAPSPIRPRSVSPLMTPIIAPTTDNPEFQKAMDDITDKVNVLIARGNAQDQVRRGFGHGPDKQPNVAVEVDKENRIVVDEGWSCVQLDADDEKPTGLGIAAPNKKGKDRRNCAHTTDFDYSHLSSVQPRREAFGVLDSPILLNAQPRISASNINGYPPNPRGSPVIGEFKGWFSNLFNWKNQSGSGNILYSPDDVATTRRDVGSMLEVLGVSLESLGGDVLRCRVDDGDLGGMKHARFRIEFTLASSGFGVAPAGSRLSQYSPNPQATTTTTPRSSVLMSNKANGVGTHHPNNNIHSSGLYGSPAAGGFPPWCICALMLVHEKGSVTTFKAVWRRLREETRGRFVATTAGGIGSPAIGGHGGAAQVYEQSQVHRFAH